MDTLVLTYICFVSPEDFFLKLTELYDVPEIKSDSAFVIQSRMAAFLKRWISSQLPDFSKMLVEEIQKWVDSVLQVGQPSLAKQISESIQNQTQARAHLRLSLIAATETKIEEITPAMFVLTVDPQEIANQLTLIDHQIYSTIRPHELLFQAWNKPQLRHRAPNVLRMISRTNNVALWVASSILWQPKLVDRANVMSKLIQVAEHLRKLNNFNSMFAVISGLLLSSINRLKFTRDKVPKKIMQTFDTLVELMSNRRSFKVYRDTLATTAPPCIPYLGVYLTDITFIEEGNMDYITPKEKSENKGEEKVATPRGPPAETDNVVQENVHNKEPEVTPASEQSGEIKKPNAFTSLIHFKKRELQFRVINEVQQFQRWPYSNIKPTNSPLLEELPRNEEDQLYGLSLLREPRNASKEQIL